MKRLTTAVLAATLMCGVSAYAYAQDNTQSAPAGSTAPASGAMGSDQSTQGGMNPAPPNGGTGSGMSAPAGSDANSSGQMQGGSAGQMQNGSGGQMQGGAQSGTSSDMSAPPAAGASGPLAPGDNSDVSHGAAEQADTPNVAVPSTFPPCTSAHQDSCVQGGHMSSSHMTRHTTHRHHKAKAKSTTTSGTNTSAPAAAPASPQ